MSEHVSAAQKLQSEVQIFSVLINRNQSNLINSVQSNQWLRQRWLPPLIRISKFGAKFEYKRFLIELIGFN